MRRGQGYAAGSGLSASELRNADGVGGPALATRGSLRRLPPAPDRLKLPHSPAYTGIAIAQKGDMNIGKSAISFAHVPLDDLALWAVMLNCCSNFSLPNRTPNEYAKGRPQSSRLEFPAAESHKIEGSPMRIPAHHG